MRVVFIGTVKFSYMALKKLIELHAEVVGVCTKEKSSFNSDYKDLTQLCRERSIPYKYVADINSQENIEWIKNKGPDIIFCFGWSSLIKKDLLFIPPKGIVGFHPASLPANRGRHPIIWALVLGIKETASTFFFMDEGADSGDILSQKSIKIDYKDDALSLYNKVTKVALKQIEEFLPLLQKNEYKRIKQDHSKANYWRKRGKKDGEIDFRMNSFAIYNLVRALTKPYIGAHLIYKEGKVKIWKVLEEEYELHNIEPGKILEIKNNTILVKCYNGAVRIIEHDFQVLPQVGEYL